MPNVFTMMFNMSQLCVVHCANALNKIDPNNMAEIEHLLGELNITLASLIIDPTIFLSFLGDPAKGKILVELQKYLPQFEPKEINDFLTIKLEIDSKVGPDANEILGSVLSLPMSLLRKVGYMNNKITQYVAKILQFYYAKHINYMIRY